MWWPLPVVAVVVTPEYAASCARVCIVSDEPQLIIVLSACVLTSPSFFKPLLEWAAGEVLQPLGLHHSATAPRTQTDGKAWPEQSSTATVTAAIQILTGSTTTSRRARCVGSSHATLLSICEPFQLLEKCSQLSQPHGWPSWPLRPHKRHRRSTLVHL